MNCRTTSIEPGACVPAPWKLIPTIVLLLGVVGCASTPPFADARGNTLPESIARLEPVEIGGMEQWLLIRGVDRANPVLLWLHGGPGAAHTPVARFGLKELEEHFVVVHWDQRGAGRSNARDFDESTMTVEQFVRDTLEVTAYLREVTGQDRIYLLGHSWGTELGLQVTRDHPEYFIAYIGVAQVVDRRLGEAIAYRRIASVAGDSVLDELGPPPYTEHHRYVQFMRLINDHGGSYDVSFFRLAVEAIRAPEYRFPQYRNWLRGANRGSGPMWTQPEYALFDARRDVPRLEIPVYFINGAQDLNTPLEATRRYYEALDAPAGKELIVFDSAAHTPFFRDPHRFVRELVRIKRENCRR